MKLNGGWKCRDFDRLSVGATLGRVVRRLRAIVLVPRRRRYKRHQLSSREEFGLEDLLPHPCLVRQLS